MGQLADYVLYLLQKVFERKKQPLEWHVEGRKKNEIRIWQYQVELEGGERHGPPFNHLSEAELFGRKLTPYQFGNRFFNIIKYWTYADENKYRYVEPEIVE